MALDGGLGMAALDGLGEYRRVVVRPVVGGYLAAGPGGAASAARGRAWRALGAPAAITQFGPVAHLAEDGTRRIAATASTRVLIYDAPTGRLVRTITKFKDVAYGGQFRRDGKMLAAGCENGTLGVFDANAGSLLRSLTGHTAACRGCAFSADDVTRIVSCGDDRTVRVWDIPSGEEERSCLGHGDYVRSLAHVVGHTYATGALDHTVKLWDIRAGKCVRTFRCGAPVAAVAAFPGGTRLAAAVGNELQVFDVMAGKMQARVVAHRKAVSCVTFAEEEDGATRMLTGGLDGLLKVYDAGSMEALHTFRHPHALLSVAVTRGATTLATGGENGVLALRQRRKDAAAARPSSAPSLEDDDVLATFGERTPRERALTAGSRQYFLRGQRTPIPTDVKVIAAKPRRAKLAKYDRMLRRFRYADALDAALATRRVEVVEAVLEELAVRGGLNAAVEGRDAASVADLVDFASRHVSQPRFAKSMLGVLARVIAAYGGAVGASAALDRALASARERVRAARLAAEALGRLGGLLAAASALGGA